MRLFEETKGYATPKNAEKKLRDVAGENIAAMHWIIAVNSQGRFVPVVTSWHSNPRGLSALAWEGICVVG